MIYNQIIEYPFGSLIIGISTNIIVILSSIGALNGLILSIFLLFSKGEYKHANRILALLVFAISLRIGKSVLISFFYAPLIIIQIGLTGFVSIGPLLYIYLLYLLEPKSKRKTIPMILAHSSSIFIFISLCLFLPPKLYLIYRHHIYFYIQLVFLFYLLISFFLWKKNRAAYKNDRKRLFILNWAKYMISGVFIIWLAYYLNVVFYKKFFYILSPILYSFILYISIFWILNKRNFTTVFSQEEKYRHSALSDDESTEYLNLLLEKTEKDKFYLDPNITITKVAEDLGTLPLYLSQIINKDLNKSFSDFINSYRLEEAKKKLSSEKYSHIKIAAIALESGFNSISSFNTAFKKQNNCTPSEFRKLRLK